MGGHHKGDTRSIFCSSAFAHGGGPVWEAVTGVRRGHPRSAAFRPGRGRWRAPNGFLRVMFGVPVVTTVN